MSTQHDPAARNVMMANQIARNVAIQGEDKAVSMIADHIRRFWDPRMRKQIFDHLDAGGEGLDPLARRAIQALRKGQEPDPDVAEEFRGRGEV